MHSGGNNFFLVVDPRELLADSGLQILNILSKVDIVRVLNAVLEGLGHVKNALNLETDSLQLRDFSFLQVPQSAVDEASNLQRVQNSELFLIASKTQKE